MKRNTLLALILVALVSTAALLWFRPIREPIPQAPTSTEPATSTAAIPQAPQYPYIEVVDSCGPYWEGVCVNMRAGPGLTYPVVEKLRTGVVLPVVGSTTVDGRLWYELSPGGTPHYPERITSKWYVASDVVQLFYDSGEHTLRSGEVASMSKRIVIDLSKQMLYAYDGDTLFMQAPVSSGLTDTPTPKGTFTVVRMTPSSYMQGPTPESDQYYDLPGVPWDLYFTQDGAAIHGTYWHNNFGKQWSHGCVNLSPEAAKKLYYWAVLGMNVIVQE